MPKASCLAMLAALMAVLHLNQPTPADCASYSFTDLGSNAWYYSEAHGLSSFGNVVGEYEPTNVINVQGFLYETNSFLDVGHLGGSPYAVAYGINDTNQVVGESDTARETHAFLYSQGTMTDLGTLAGLTGYSSAHAINRAGDIVGESSVSFSQVGTIDAVLYSGTKVTDLGALSGDYSAAFAINNQGVIVGESDIVQAGVTNVHAFVYTNGVSTRMTDLGTLGGTYSSARGVNDSGTIVGESDALVGGASETHAFMFQNGVMTDLGTFGGSSSSASAINAAGLIVGYATDTNGVSDAFLYDGSRMINLNAYLPPASSGWTNFASADAINDAGQIAGSGFLADGSYHAYLLTPTADWIGIASPTLLTNGQFEFAIEGPTGEQFAILASSNLVNWTALATNTLQTSSQTFTVPQTAAANARYFRAEVAP